MRERFEFLFHCITLLLKIIRLGGYKAVIAESLALQRQLILVSNTREYSPALTTFDHTLTEVIAQCISSSRIKKVAVYLKQVTILRFSKALVTRKHQILYSNEIANDPAPKPLDKTNEGLLSSIILQIPLGICDC